jgi:hypothetical protein
MIHKVFASSFNCMNELIWAAIYCINASMRNWLFMAVRCRLHVTIVDLC